MATQKPRRSSQLYSPTRSVAGSGTGSIKTLTKAETFERKQYGELIFKATYAGEEYAYDGKFAPNIVFYKFLARNPNYPSKSRNSTLDRLKMWIPDTIVFNDGNPIWIYSTMDGYVERLDRFQDKHVLTKLEKRDNMDEIVLVAKRPTFNPRTKRNGVNNFPITSKELEARLAEFTHGERC
jgi:hypothetical protein